MYEIALKALTSLGEWLTKLRSEARAETTQAAGLLRKATVDTTLYVSKLSVGGVPSSDEQAAISRVWSEASTAFRLVDRSISDRCMEVALLVASTPEITEDQVNQLAIAVKRIYSAGAHYKMLD